MPTRKPTQPAGIAFGRKLAFATTRRLDYSVTDDEKAFEIRFETALAAGVGSPSFAGVKKSKAPIGTAVFAAVIPARGKAVKASLSLNGFFVAPPGTSVAVIAMANDQQVVRALRNSKDDKGFTVSVPLRAGTLSEIRLVVMLVAQQEGGSGDASALVAISDIGADTFVPKKKAPAKKG